MNTPNKNSYENALETVKAYEKRIADLKKLNKDLSYKLSKFESVKFKIDKNNGEIIFAGVTDDELKLVLGKSQCSPTDIYEEVIGKLLAVKNALHEDTKEIVKYVEQKPNLGGGISTIGTIGCLHHWNIR